MQDGPPPCSTDSENEGCCLTVSGTGIHQAYQSLWNITVVYFGGITQVSTMAPMIETSQGLSAGHEMTNLSGTYSLHVEIGDVISRFGSTQNGKGFLTLLDFSVQHKN